MFGAVGAVSPQELGGEIGATERVRQIAVASLAPTVRRRPGLLPKTLCADLRKYSILNRICA